MDTTVLPEPSTFPVRVRPTLFETVDSYASRLATANGISDGVFASWLKVLSAHDIDVPLWDRAALVENIAGVQPGHFARGAALLPRHADGQSCVNCTTGLTERYGCTRCSNGARVTEAAHDGPRVCKRHSRWVGPADSPELQFQVGGDVLRADRKYRHLRREGVLDAHRLAELTACVDLWAEAEESSSPDPAERFRVAVELAARVMRSSVLSRLVARDAPPSSRYAQLTHAVDAVVGQHRHSVVLVDAIWLLIRTAGHSEAGAAHAFICPAAEEDCDDSGYLNEIRTCSYPRQKHLHELQFVSSTRGGSRSDTVGGLAALNNYVCVRGHRFQSSLAMFRRTKASGGCGYCANKRVRSGFNSLADTHPSIAARWHPTLNDGLRPDDVLAGAAHVAAWLCEDGHTTWQKVRARKRGSGCLVCSNRIVHPAVNALSHVRPDVAADWHSTLNGDLSADEVTATTERVAWWRCTLGHDYQMAISQRSRGGRCRVCSRTDVHPSTSLAATHPDVAKWWNQKENGELTPDDVLSGSGRRVWWSCGGGHSYQAIVLNQTRKMVCPACSTKAVTEENCLLRTHPELSTEIAVDRNGGLGPEDVTAGSARRFWWRCRHGHEWQTEVRNRVRGSRCPFCSNRRVWEGWNDMATTHPELAAQWSAKNGALKPTDVVAGTNKSIWWECKSGHEWRATGNDRVSGHGCGRCLRAAR